MLDGLTLGANPFKASFPKDAVLHKVKVSAPAHVTVEKVIAYQQDTSEIEIELERIGAAARGPGGKKEPKDPGAGAAPPTDQPAHPIDEKDPYSP